MWAYREAMEARDVDAMLAEMSPEVILHSPATGTAFRGIDEIARLYREVFGALDGFEITHELGDGSTRALWIAARLGGGEVTLAELFELDDHGKIREITITGRPLHGSALFFKAVGPRLAAKNHGERRGRLVATMTRPFPGLLGALDRLGTRLAR